MAELDRLSIVREQARSSCKPTFLGQERLGSVDDPLGQLKGLGLTSMDDKQTDLSELGIDIVHDPESDELPPLMLGSLEMKRSRSSNFSSADRVQDRVQCFSLPTY